MALTEARKRAQQRYSQKTKTVSFRVPNELYDELEAIKAKANVSYADFVKTGARVCKREMQAKLKRIGGLENRIATLEGRKEQLKLELEQFLSEEKKRRLKELDDEMRCFALFKRGWGIEEVALKLSFTKETVNRYFMEWEKEREITKDRKTIERELVLKCLKKYIEKIRGGIAWYQIMPDTLDNREKLTELTKQKEYAENLLRYPARISKYDRQKLISDYSSEV
jgi:Arc/MetJ-type ribon-helix-helix transcriptional regulator